MSRIHARWLLLFFVPALTAIPATPQTESFELDEASIAQMQTWMAGGRYSSRQLTELYLSRIDRIDRNGPQLRSISEVNPDALAIATALDGIPIIIKDNIDTADRMMTTAGSLALERSIAARDAFAVGRLRAAGAVILA